MIGRFICFGVRCQTYFITGKYQVAVVFSMPVVSQNTFSHVTYVRVPLFYLFFSRVQAGSSGQGAGVSRSRCPEKARGVRKGPNGEGNPPPWKPDVVLSYHIISYRTGGWVGDDRNAHRGGWGKNETLTADWYKFKLSSLQNQGIDEPQLEWISGEDSLSLPPNLVVCVCVRIFQWLWRHCLW